MLYIVPRFPTYTAAARWPRYLARVFALSFTAAARWPGDGSRVTSPRRVPLKDEKNTGLPEHERLRPVSWRVRLGSKGSDCHHSTSAPTRTQEHFVMLLTSHNDTSSQLVRQITVPLIACQAVQGRMVME
jgi:hypothetical protein